MMLEASVFMINSAYKVFIDQFIECYSCSNQLMYSLCFSIHYYESSDFEFNTVIKNNQKICVSSLPHKNFSAGNRLDTPALECFGLNYICSNCCVLEKDTLRFFSLLSVLASSSKF